MKRRIAFLLPLLCLLCSCAPTAREPDGLALARVLFVEGSAPVTLTAVCETGEDEDQPLRGSITAADFQAARAALPWTGDRELALTSLSYLIINQDADLKAVAAAVLADHELSPGASVWLAEDAAALAEDCPDPVGRLEVLEEQGVRAPTAAEALAALETDGSAALPLLIWTGERLEAAGAVRWEGSDGRG